MTDLDTYLPAIQAGDSQAFARWVAGAEERVRLSLSRFADHVDAESVLQETLLRAWQVAPRVVADGRGDSLLRLAVRIARNLAISETRRLRPGAVPPELLDESPAPELPPPDPMLRRVIALCREKLPRKPAQALTARLERGSVQPDELLAAGVGMRLNTFLQNITRARKLLETCLEKHGVLLGGAR